MGGRAQIRCLHLIQRALVARIWYFLHLLDASLNDAVTARRLDGRVLEYCVLISHLCNLGHKRLHWRRPVLLECQLAPSVCRHMCSVETVGVGCHAHNTVQHDQPNVTARQTPSHQVGATQHCKQTSNIKHCLIQRASKKRTVHDMVHVHLISPWDIGGAGATKFHNWQRFSIVCPNASLEGLMEKAANFSGQSGSGMRWR